MRTSNASDLTDSRVWNAGSGSGESSEHSKTTFRVASLNVGSLKNRGNEAVETMFRRRVDICAIQEHRWAGGTESNQSRILKGKNSAYSFIGVAISQISLVLDFFWQKNGQIIFLKFIVSQTGF